MLLHILAATPKWVFVLFFVLLAFGVRQLRASRPSLKRVAIMPVAMTTLAIFGVISVFGAAPAGLVGWAAAALVTAAFVLRRPLPASTRYDAATRTFDIAGSAVPLALMMGVFFTKYVVGVQLGMHPQLAHQSEFALAVSTLYGAFSGMFAARGIRLWRLALDQRGSGTKPGNDSGPADGRGRPITPLATRLA